MIFFTKGVNDPIVVDHPAFGAVSIWIESIGPDSCRIGVDAPPEVLVMTGQDTCPKCNGAGGPPAGRECRYEDVCDFCDGTGIWPDGKPCPEGMHEWEWLTNPSSPSGPEEHFKVCKVCGMEYPGSWF